MQNNSEVYNFDRSNDTHGVFQFRRLFFKTNGSAFNTQEELTNLMVLIYEQNSYNETFSILQIQRLLDDMHGSSRSENLSKLAIILERIATRSFQLDTIKAQLDGLRDKISEEQLKFESQDTVVNHWFESVFQSVSKTKNSITFLKEALNYKIETIEKIKIIFSTTIFSEDDFTKVDSLLLKLKEFLDTQHLKLEHIYAEIEDLNETKLETIRTRVCKNRSPSLFQPNNIDNNQLSTASDDEGFVAKS